MWFFLACSAIGTRERVEPSFLAVGLAEGTEAGSAEAPLPFSSAPSTVGITVQALDIDGKPYPWPGTVTLKSRPGRIEPDHVNLDDDGAYQGSVSIEAGFGPTRAWALDEDTDDDRVPGWAAGVSEPVWWAFPTLAEMQATDNHETNQLAGEFAELRIADRQVVVAAIDAAGFWASDLLDAATGYAGIYVYTFNKPDESIVIGAQLSSLNGQDQEYLGSTQLSWPTYGVVEGVSLTPPDAMLLTEAACGDDNEMEKLEASRVRAESPTIPASFTTDSEEYADYEEYGQWPISFGSCTLYVESGSSVPEYFPPDHAGETLEHVEGMIKEVYGKWIFTILDAEGIGATKVSP
ncbi:MAG: hypothetical protein FJ102_12425 [Deltaproteobacteria bacterium]|nr:hypothetical protein [Deltaproteobacteria bacterium]